jgi:hypothetical protein
MQYKSMGNKNEEGVLFDVLFERITLAELRNIWLQKTVEENLQI